jgi:hypothetical protein
MRSAVGAGIVISVLIALNELRFIGRTSLAFVLLGIAFVLILYGAALWRALEGR